MKNEAFEGVMAGLQEALAHSRGEAVPGLVVHEPRKTADLDVAAIRRRTGASQACFARSIGIAVSTLRNWEQGRRRPEGPARVLLALLDRNPRVVQELLGEAA
jgi:putative transcriptional regulator